MKPPRTKNEPIPSKALHPEKTELSTLQEWFNKYEATAKAGMDSIMIGKKGLIELKKLINAIISKGLNEEESDKASDKENPYIKSMGLYRGVYWEGWQACLKWANNTLTKRKI